MMGLGIILYSTGEGLNILEEDRGRTPARWLCRRCRRRRIHMRRFLDLLEPRCASCNILPRAETPSFTVGSIIQLAGQTLIVLGCIAFTTCPVGDYDLDEAKTETKRRYLAIVLLLYLVHAFFEVR